MKITCSGSNKKTGKPCSRKVAIEGGWCYQHKIEKHVKIPEDISQVIGRKPVITSPKKKPELIVIDDAFEDGKEIPEEIFETVITPPVDVIVHSTDTIIHGNANTAYLPDNIEHLNPSRTFPKKKGKIKYITITKNYSHPWIKKLWKRIKDFFRRNKKETSE